MTSRPPVGEDTLRSSLLKSRIAKLPHLPAIAPSQWSFKNSEEKEEDGLGDLSMAPPPRSAFQRSAESKSLDHHYTPLSARDCFQEALEVDIDHIEGGEVGKVRVAETESHEASSSSLDSSQASSRATFRVYYTPPIHKTLRKGTKERSAKNLDLNSLPSLDSLDAAPEVEESDSNSKTIFLFHHGAGYSALSYALVAKHITEISKGEAGVLAFDCRGHGKTRHSSAAEAEEMSLKNLTKDSMAVISKLFPPSKPQPTLILVGHSMGGSVVVSLCHALSAAAKNGPVPRVAGVAVLDVVEGTAMSALSGMKTIVSALPKGFNSVEEAIRWHVDSGTIVNAQSARRSVPSLLEKNGVEQAAAAGQDKVPDNYNDGDEEEAVEELQSASSPVLVERGEQSQYAYRWRANLLATEPYWSGWFEGLSQSFLSVKCARLLLLAGTDRLDKDLMIGQMQGKYQLVVFADVGHSLQEDAPERTAQTLMDFWKRNESLDLTSIRGGLRKVGQS